MTIKNTGGTQESIRVTEITEKRKGGKVGTEERTAKERKGTAGKMTGWDYHSLHSVPWVKVGKNQSSKARNKRSRFYVD